MTKGHQRVVTVRPRSMSTRNCINPLHEDSGEVGAEKEAVREVDCEAWEETVKKIEELETKVIEHFEQQSQEQQRSPPIIKAPAKPTQEQWERHQVTHTPFAPWCPHYLAAMNVRRNHPSKGRGTHSSRHRIRRRCNQGVNGLYVFARETRQVQ